MFSFLMLLYFVPWGVFGSKMIQLLLPQVNISVFLSYLKFKSLARRIREIPPISKCYKCFMLKVNKEWKRENDTKLLSLNRL